LKLTASFTFVEPCKQYHSTTEFNFIDSTMLINLGDPCKHALRVSFMTLLLLSQCHAAFSTIPSPLVWVDQSPVSQCVS